MLAFFAFFCIFLTFLSYLSYFITFYKKRFSTIDLNIIIYDNESNDKTIEIAKSNNCLIYSYSTNNTVNDVEYLNIKNN